MSHPSKLKGNRLERLVVKMSEEAGLSAKRAYASDGRSLGEAEDVDVLIDGKWKEAGDDFPWERSANI